MVRAVLRFVCTSRRITVRGKRTRLVIQYVEISRIINTRVTILPGNLLSIRCSFESPRKVYIIPSIIRSTIEGGVVGGALLNS